MLSYGSNCYSQKMTTMGTDFWVAPNIHFLSGQSNDNITLSHLYIFITGPRNCIANISNPHNNFDTTLTIIPGQISRIQSIQTVRSLQSDIITSCGFHITATDSVSVYIYNVGTSSDATNVLSTYALRNDYIIQTYPSPSNSQFNTQYAFNPSSNFTIVATEDSTHITILLNGTTTAGDSTGDTLNVFIPQAGLCYQVLSTLNSDLSGTRITASEGKRIAVFEGNDRANQLSLAEGFLHNCHLDEQAIPSVFWGRHFFPDNFIQRPNKIRITSLANNCSITINNQYITTIGERQTYEYQMSGNRTIDYINTSQPACVGLYTQSNITGNDINAEMLIVPPWEQSSEGVVFGISTPVFFLHHEQLHIITKSDETHFLKLDSNNISNYFHPIDVNPAFSYARFYVEPGAHSLNTTDGEGFVAWISDANTYHHAILSAGSALRDAQNSLTINNVTNANWIDTIEVCTYEDISMSVVSLYGFDSVQWLLGDGYNANAGQITHSFSHVGQYGVRAIVYASCDGCYKQIDTLISTIAVFGPDTTYTDTTICSDTFIWQDSTYNEGDQITSLYQNRHGCDSLKISTLHFSSPTFSVVDTILACDSLLFHGVWYSQDGLISYNTLTNASGCDSVLYHYVVINSIRSSSIADTLYGCDSLLFNNIWYFHNTVMAFDTLTGANSCDSILFHAIVINKSYDRTQEITIRDTATLTWLDGNTYNEPTDEPYIVLQAKNGCDSTIHLHLTVLPTPQAPPVDSTTLWIPNTFTPEEKTNNEFYIFSHDIISAEVSIFSREGIHICSFDGLTESWDGTYKGVLCPQNAYIYIITYTTKSRPQYKQQKIGSVLLLR